MALIKLGGLAQDVRGSLNGSVFSRNRGGAYVRTKVSPVQPLSKWSGLVRCVFPSISAHWSTVLTAAQRADWEAWAATHPIANVFGDAVILSGVACYMRINAYLRMCGCAYLAGAPTTFAVADPGTPAIVATAVVGVLSLKIAAGRALTGDEGMMGFLTAPLQASRKVQNSDYKMLNLSSMSSWQNADPLDSRVLDRLPLTSWAVGQRIGILCAVLNKVTGATSSWIPVVHTITAP
jgi:hypothetical protein